MSQVQVESYDNSVETLSQQPEECLSKSQKSYDYNDELSKKFKKLLYDDLKPESISLPPCPLTQNESNGTLTSTSSVSLQHNTSLEPFGPHSCVLDPELYTRNHFSYREAVNGQAEELSNSPYHLPDIAAQLDESPWVWGKIDTSPLKLSDMQLSTATPDSIRRQRRLYTKSSNTLHMRHDEPNSMSHSTFQTNSSNSQQSPRSQKQHLHKTDSYKEEKRNSMRSLTLNKDFSSNITPSLSNEKEKKDVDGGDNSVQETSVKNPSLSNSNKSFNLPFNIGMLHNISDESISLTYTHTEQLSSEASDSNECINKVTCVDKIDNSSSGNSLSLTSPSKSDVSLQSCRKSNSSERGRKEHELLNFIVTPKPEVCKNNSERSRSPQKKTRNVYLSRHSCLKDETGFSKELGLLESNHKNHQALLKPSKNYLNNKKTDQLPKDSISVSMEASSMSSEASAKIQDHYAGNLVKTFSSEENEQIKRVNLSSSEESSNCKSQVFWERNNTDNVETEAKSVFSQENSSSRLSCEVAKWRRLCQETMACAHRYKPKVLNKNSLKYHETPISSANTTSSKSSTFSGRQPSNRKWTSFGKTELSYSFDSTPKESCQSNHFVTDQKNTSSSMPSQVTICESSVCRSHSQENTQTSNTLDFILSEQSNGSSTTYKRLMGQVYSGVTPRSFISNPTNCTSAITTSTRQSMSSTPYFMLNSVCTPVTTKSEDRLPPLAPRYTSNISGVSSSITDTIPNSSASISEFLPTSQKEQINNVGQVLEKYTNVKGFVNPDNYYHHPSSTDTVYSSSVCLSNPTELTSQMFSANSNTVTNETSSTHSFYFSAPSTNSSLNSMIQQSTKTSSLRSLGTDSPSLSNAILLCNLKKTPDVKGEKEYGRCCFFQGPTPATSENQRVVRKVSERTSRESYEFNQEASTLHGIPAITCSRELNELTQVVSVKEKEDEEGLFITPYPVRQTEGSVIQELVQNPSSRHVRFDADVEVQLNMPCQTQHDTLQKEKTDGFSTCKTISRRRAIKHWSSRKKSRARKHTSLCLKRIKLINSADDYGTGDGKKQLITYFSSKYPQKPNRLFARKRLICVASPKVLKDGLAKISPNKNVPVNPFENRDGIVLRKKKSFTLRIAGIYKTCVLSDQKNECLHSIKPIVTVSESASNDLPCLWLELNQKVRDYGLSRNGIPALEENVCTVYTDLLLKSQKTKRINDSFSKKRTLISVKDKLITCQNAPKTCKKPKAASSKVKLENLLQQKRSLKNVSNRGFNVDDDAVSQLVANVDTIKVLQLWNTTLNELIKYQQYCSELCNLEGPHLRVFQKNDALQKENCVLKEKVDVLERHLRQIGASESELWDSQIDNYGIMVENERLKKLVNEEKEKLKIVLFQKRQQDTTVNQLKSKLKRFIEKENRIRIKAKETITSITRRLPAIKNLKEISEKSLCESKKPCNKVLMRETLSYFTKGDFKNRGMTTLRKALCEDVVIPCGSFKGTNSNRFKSLKSKLSQDESIAYLVWYYEEQIDEVEREKEEISKKLMNARKLLKRQFQKEDNGQMEKGTKQSDANTFRISLSEFKESKCNVYGPSEGKFLETMATTATIHGGETFHRKEEALSTGDVVEYKNKKDVEVSLQESKKPLCSSSRWIVNALQTQLQNTIEEKTKKELLYENEIKELKKNQTQPEVNDICKEKDTFFDEVTEAERCCDILLKNKAHNTSTKLLMQRDKKLFQSGLHNRLLKLHEAGGLLSIVDTCCRAIKLEDPQKLAEIVQKLVAVTQEAVEQKRFIDSVASTLGVSYLNEQRRYEDIQRILLQWRRVLANADTLISIRRLVIRFLNLIQKPNTKNINQVNVLRSCLNAQKSEAYSSSDGELISVLSCICNALKEKIKSEELSTEGNTVECETKLSEDREMHGVKELTYFMDLFKIPSVDLCKTAMDRLHLKITEHIRFYRSLLKVLGLDSSLSPLQVIEEVSLIKHAKPDRKNKDTDASLINVVKGLSSGMVSDELKNFLKVFRAIQVRLNLPNLPSGSLSKMLISIGDEEPYDNDSLQRHTSLLEQGTHEQNEYEESVNGLLSCSSLSSSSVISLSCDNLKNKTQWKNWAQVTFFTIDLMARIVEQFRFASKKKLKNSTKVCTETNQT